jgi:hypothetical protein
MMGGFKTCHAGFLTLIHLSKTGLGTKAHKPVVIKQAYEKVRNAKKGGAKVHRLPENEQYDAIRAEAESMYWAKPILKESYRRILAKWPSGAFTVKVTDGHDGSDIIEEVIIPRLRWVDCGIAFINPGTLDKQTVLVEEKIPGTFVKYVHNTESKPASGANKPGTERCKIAEFLVFTQHLQWEFTHQTVFLSDYQGAWSAKWSTIDLIKIRR